MEYKTEECIVAFVDILGATEKIKEDPNKSLNIVHKAYDESLKLLRLMFNGEFETILKPNAKIFSDNIVVSIKAVPEKANSLLIMCGFLSLLQSQFLLSGYLVRGGIAIGEFFIDDTMAWGDALIKAYKMESEIAIYPRIVIHPELTELLNVSTNEHIKNYVLEDSDGLLFLDFLFSRLHVVDNERRILIKKFYDDCEIMIEKNKNNIKVMQKIQWHYTYLINCFIELFGEESSDNNA